MTQSIEHQMIEIYCLVDDFLQARPALRYWRRSAHSRPHFSAAEVMTIAVLQNVFGVATLKQTYRLIAHNYGAAFPHLPSYAQWLNRLHQLDAQITELLLPVKAGHARRWSGLETARFKR